jgi:hypothetical protein
MMLKFMKCNAIKEAKHLGCYMYLTILFTMAQCSLSGASINLLATPTAKAMSGLELTRYLKLPIMLLY